MLASQAGRRRFESDRPLLTKISPTARFRAPLCVGKCGQEALQTGPCTVLGPSEPAPCHAPIVKAGCEPWPGDEGPDIPQPPLAMGRGGLLGAGRRPARL